MKASVQNFEYNGFYVMPKSGIAPYEVIDFISWTNDPGIGKFMCSDGIIRLIPSCQLSKEYLSTIPQRPKLNPFEGNGVFFGVPSSSKLIDN
jgi:hypothetical protein